MQELLRSRSRKFGFGCFAIAMLFTFAWGSSAHIHVLINWTRNGDMNQVGSYRSGLYWIRTEQWWCDVPLKLDVDSVRFGANFGEWPGFRNASHREFVGFQFTEGIWHPPLLDMDFFRDAERLPRSANFHSWFVPYWPFVLSATLLSAFLIASPSKTTRKGSPQGTAGKDPTGNGK